MSTPYSTESEQAVLAALLVDAPRRMPIALAVVEPRAFWLESHRKMFNALCAVWERGGAVTPSNLAAELARVGDLAACGGPESIAALLLALDVDGNFGERLRVVVDLAEIRERIALLRPHAA